LIAVKEKAGGLGQEEPFWSWVIFVVGALYFLVPLAATFYWSLRAEKDTLGFEAYRRLFADANFLPSFSESIVNAVAAILISLLLMSPPLTGSHCDCRSCACR
jgi:ABC-type spermidine/putrescine transport system permease subunit II